MCTHPLHHTNFSIFSMGLKSPPTELKGKNWAFLRLVLTCKATITYVISKELKSLEEDSITYFSKETPSHCSGPATIAPWFKILPKNKENDFLRILKSCHWVAWICQYIFLSRKNIFSQKYQKNLLLGMLCVPSDICGNKMKYVVTWFEVGFGKKQFKFLSCFFAFLQSIQLKTVLPPKLATRLQLHKKHSFKTNYLLNSDIPLGCLFPQTGP